MLSLVLCSFTYFSLLPEVDPLDILLRLRCFRSSALSKAPDRRRIAARQAAVADIGLVA